jgi:hypothetical protein
MSPKGMGLTIGAGGVVGAVTGALLARYWWDFPPEDDAYDFLIVPIYATIGGVVGLFGAAMLLALTLLGRGILSRLRDSRR